MLLKVCGFGTDFIKEYESLMFPSAYTMPESSLRAVLAANMRRLRKKYGYSQENLAELCELHRTYIGSVERRERNISLDSLESIAKALRVSVSELLIQRDDNDS